MNASSNEFTKAEAANSGAARGEGSDHAMEQGTEALAYLIGVSGPAEDTIISLSRAPTIIGRGPAAKLNFKDNRLSREHCLFMANADGSVNLVDLHSSNGTVVNGRRVKKAKLSVDDRIDVGSSVFRLSESIPSHLSQSSIEHGDGTLMQ